MVIDRISSVKVSLVVLPLQSPASDAKVLTEKQKPLSEVAFLFAEIQSEDGNEGVGYSYALRAGAPALYAHARELAPALIGENPNNIQRIWSKLAWLGQSVGRSGVTAEAVAAFDVALWDLKAKRARLHIHLSAAYELDTWVEHFDWLEPLFDERLEIRRGRMHVPWRHGPGFSISEQAKAWTAATDTFTETLLLAPQH
jgi:L-alanine-DL-glutamate epimerase-like enolase superfamily enzyme